MLRGYILPNRRLIIPISIVIFVLAVVAALTGTPEKLYLYAGHPFGGHKGNHMPMVENHAAALQIASETQLSSVGWTASASDSQTGYPASAVLDGNTATFWHTDYSTEPDKPFPHSITIDMKRVNTVSRLAYLPRQTGTNGQIGKYEIFLSLDGITWGSPVHKGLWADVPSTGAKPEQFADFRASPARYIRLVTQSEAGNRGPWSTIAELRVHGSIENYMAMPRSGWTVTASDAQAIYPASNVLDNDLNTIWHTDYSTEPDKPLPHSITLDMKAQRSIRALSYYPRQSTSPNGRIGDYSIDVSPDNATWTNVKKGKWVDDATEKAAAFTPVSARYVRLTAVTEAGNRGPWSSAANIYVYDTAEDLPILSRSGWTATGSDFQSGFSPAALLDGNSETIWHSDYSTEPDKPLPHSVTIDMKAQQTVTALTYLPRQDSAAEVNGTIGSYRVSVSSDGATWTQVATGKWADNRGHKAVRIPATAARYVMLTALTEAGNRGPWSSGSELYIHGVEPVGGAAGKWGNVIGFPLVPTSGVMLPNNKLMVFSAYSSIGFNRIDAAVTKVAILDLNTDTLMQPPDVDTDHQMFCSGTAMLADGRVLINGGSGDYATTIYNPFTNTWTKGPLMNIPRAYQGTTLLSDGRVFTFGGSWNNPSNSTGVNKDAEIFTPSGTTGTWSLLSNVKASAILTNDPAGRYRADNHAWLFAGSGGSVFHAGPSKQMNWISTSGSGSITAAGLRGDSDHAMNGTAVMYDINKIVSMGGATVYQDAGSVVNSQAHRKGHRIDLSKGYGVAPTVTSTGLMKYQRVFGNSIVLPSGSVMALGGQQHPEPFTDTAPAMTPELWSPSTNSFTSLATETIPRTYHSLALLLPDGRVFSGGGGLCGGCKTNHTDGQIYTPAYLLNANGTLRARPSIVTAPTVISRGTNVAVTTSGNTPQFSLVRMSAVTHSVNNDQRRIPLSPVSTSGTAYTLAIPADAGVVLPGYYMLFALDTAGTPSVSKIVRLQ